MPPSIAHDLAAVARIGAVPTILRTIRELTGLRFTLVARVLPDRWIACAVHDDIEFGLKAGGELDVATTLCSQVRDTREAVIIDEAATDPHYCNHPTPKMYGFQSYIAVPLFRRDGEYFGTVCGLDPDPHPLKDGKTLATFKLFSELISLQLEAEDNLATKETELNDQREASKVREQFIAVLGHDVRNPLASIAAGTDLVLRKTKDETDRRTLERVRASTRRIGGLVDDLLDLARGRLGGGIRIATTEVDDLAGRLRHVVEEVQAAHTSRQIRLTLDIGGTVRCDVRRVEQVLSNLLANAIEHGRAETAVDVTIGGNEQIFAIEVTNRGQPIPSDVQASLFQPYFRGGQSARRDGLGLGLYIVSEVAKSHDGDVSVRSTSESTTFRFEIPRHSATPSIVPE